MSDILEIKRRLADRAQSVAEMLLPQGRKIQNEWRVGSINGEPGESLGVHLSGEKVGVWKDFNGGEGGDLIDLWMVTRRLTLTQVLDEACAYLGIDRPKAFRESKKQYTRPAKPRCTVPQNRVRDYLTQDRGIPFEILRRYQIGEDGNKIIFPFILPDGELVLAKAREAIAGADPKPTAANCEPILFGWQAIPENAREVVITEGECLLGTTEVMTQTGWVNLADYRGGAVAQWRETGDIQWAVPLAKIDKHYHGDVLHFSDRFVTMTVTPGHRMPGFDQRGALRIVTAEEREQGWRADILPRSGVLDGHGIGLSEDQLALCLAVSADAAIDVRKQSFATGKIAVEDRYARITLFKKRKQERLTSLLGRLGMTCRRTEGVNNGKRSDGIFFGLPIPDWVPGRILPWEWIADATAHEREFLLSELRHWDGNEVPNRTQHEFSTKHRELADWVQALCHTSGRCSTIIERRNRLGTWLKVSILHGKKHGTYQQLKPSRIVHDGRMYCLTVPSGMFLARENGRVFVTGNCDALTMAAFGFPAMSVPFGGGGKGKQNWIENEFDRMQRFEKIYIATDMDKPGDEAAAEIVSRLGRHRCYRVQMPYKDANECWLQGVSPEQMAALIASAQPMDPEGLCRASAFLDRVTELFYPRRETPLGYSLPYAGLNGEIIFRPGEMTVWAGATGSGKTQILCDCVPFWIKKGSRICVASFEMKCEQTLKRMVKQAGGVDRPTVQFLQSTIAYLDEGLLLYEKVGRSSVPTLLDVFDYARAKYGCDQFVIDSLMRLGIAQDDYTGQQDAVFAMVDWSGAHNVHLHLVAHSRKGERGHGAPEIEDVKGAMEIGANAHNIITIWRNRKLEETESGDPRDKPDMTEQPGVTLNVAKQRNGDFEEKVKLYFNRRTYQYFSAIDNRKLPRCYVQDDVGTGLLSEVA